MRWRVAELFEHAPTGGRDALGNPVTERRSLGECMVRATPYGGERAENAGNGYFDAPLMVVTPKPMKAVGTASEAVIGGTSYRVTGMSDLGRMRLIALQEEKGAAWAGSA